jgi:ribonuclease VapC
MIVDASAILAILLDEPEASQMEDKILMATSPAMSPVNYLEAAVRVDGLGSEAKSRKFDELFALLAIDIAPTNIEQAKLAREAYKKFGRGNHKAKLNLGDCFAYALAKARGESLLFKGDDFRLTDVEAAV